RLSPDINELNLPKTCEIDFSDQDDLLHFRLLICPDEVGLSPVSPPVTCVTSLSPPFLGPPPGFGAALKPRVLREQEPNPEDPLNKEAAEVLQSNRRLFEQNVQRSLRGGYVGATYFERCLK
ncbi:UBC12 enzyme, partial [Dyaphorophyia castanea]|nr:UBC12 enzyme [Platysteira castanea]